MSDLPTILLRLFAAVVVVFMLVPLLVLILFCFSERSLVTFPITGFTLEWFVKLFERPAFWNALAKQLDRHRHGGNYIDTVWHNGKPWFWLEFAPGSVGQSCCSSCCQSCCRRLFSVWPC